MAGTRGGATETFRDLALALTDEERRELHKKISRSLSLKDADDPPIYKRQVEASERHDLIIREIDKLTVWRRIRFFLRRVFTTKPHDDAFVEFRLQELKRRIRAVCSAMSPLEHHSVCPEIAAATWDLYQAAYPLIPMFLDLWRSGNYLQESIEFLLSKQIPASRTDLMDFATMEELQDAYLENELKGDVRRLVVERLGLYLDDIPEDLFKHLEEGVLPLYFLRPVCLLDYNRLFEVFGYDPGVAPPEGTPTFKVAPTSAALPHVEALYFAVHTASRLERGFHVHLELLDRYLDMKAKQEADEDTKSNVPDTEFGGADKWESVSEDETADQLSSAEEPADDNSEARERLQRVRDDLGAVHDAALGLADHVPFPEVVKFYRRDPWHRMAAYMPKLRLRDFHQSYLTMRVLSQLDTQFGEVRVGVVARMTQELFGESTMPFEYFRPTILSAPDKLGLPRFRHVKSATVMYNFFRRVYRPRLQEMVRTLSRILPVRQRDSSSALVVHVAGIEQSMSDLEGFDRSFAPDSDDGKAFFRVRYGVEKDVTLHRSYRNIVQQKDREVRSTVDVAREHFRGLRQVFENLQRTASDQLRHRYAEADQRASSVDGLDTLLGQYIEKMELFEKLMKQILAMEEGY